LKGPFFSIVIRDKLYCDMVPRRINHAPCEKGAIPSHKDSPRGPNGGGVFKLVKMLGYWFFKSQHVNTLHFGLLDTENGTIAFLNLASDGILFITIIKSSDIPIEDIPRSVVVVIHLLTNWAADQGYCHR
jgi:hypothetical protein